MTYSRKDLDKAPSPRVLLNVCTHGNERVGLKVATFFKKLKPVRGTLVINVANQEAVKAHKRFINSDLNRVFPGKQNGDHEERLASRMVPFVRAFDYVIDVHSTETGIASSVIITKSLRKLKPLLKAISPKRVILMSATKSNALISEAKMGIALEYGKDKDPRTYKETLSAIKRALSHLGLITRRIDTSARSKSAFFEAYAVFEKPEGFEANMNIRNFVLLKKGAVIGYNKATGERIFAKKSFYPILFGNNSYKSIFGFIAKKTKL